MRMTYGGAGFGAFEAAWDDDSVKGLLGHAIEGCVRHDAHVAAAEDRLRTGHSGEDDFDAAASEHVDRDDRLHLFGAFGQED